MSGLFYRAELSLLITAPQYFIYKQGFYSLTFDPAFLSSKDFSSPLAQIT
jgi:hypothetical protein